jgi:hypothetical protein
MAQHHCSVDACWCPTPCSTGWCYDLGGVQQRQDAAAAAQHTVSVWKCVCRGGGVKKGGGEEVGSTAVSMAIVGWCREVGVQLCGIDTCWCPAACC